MSTALVVPNHQLDKPAIIGDPVIDTSFFHSFSRGSGLGWAHTSAMPGTAVGIVYSSQGFAIAGDGLEHLQDEHGIEVVNDERQKIFEIVGNQKTLAYVLAGSAVIKHRTAETQHDIEADVRHAVREPPTSDELTIWGYVDRIARAIYDGLLAAKQTGTIDEYPDHDREGGISTLLLAGYYKARPVGFAIPFLHKSQRLLDPFPLPWMPKPGCIPQLYGSKYVREALLEGRASPLQDYRCPAFEKLGNRQDITLEEAQKAAKAFIDACCDSRAKAEDENCKLIGGHIHLARITPSKGFKWVIPPKASSPGK